MAAGGSILVKIVPDFSGFYPNGKHGLPVDGQWTVWWLLHDTMVRLRPAGFYRHHRNGEFEAV